MPPAQLVQYMASERVRYGIFVIIAFNDEEIKKISKIELELSEIEKRYGMKIFYIFFDAREKSKTPSQLKKGEAHVIDGTLC
jgi:predicted homoserine dehydrogenase-like protein